MKTAYVLRIVVAICLAMSLCASVVEAAPLGTAFTYQGRLIDSNDPADGLYDMRFKLYDTVSDGDQVGNDVNLPDISVTDGYFTARLDFGSAAFGSEARWLEVGVRPGDSTGGYTALSPRQKVMPAPNALASMEVRGRVRTPGIYETDLQYGDVWTVKESNRNWRSVAMSADGTVQTAVVRNGQIYISTDSGNTWAAKESNRDWSSVAMSADGMIQTAVVDNGQIYVSTDSGNTWTPKESNRYWYSVAMSADGTIQTAVDLIGVGGGGQIYVSTDSGNTWAPKGSSLWWYSVAMSADGTVQTAVVDTGQIYVSTDSGNTWAPKESNRGWRSVAMSADGTIQTAVVAVGKIYVSTDSGNTWAAKESNRSWQSVAMSADGTIQTAVVSTAQIYGSTDSGNTWTAKESNRNWVSVAMSEDGTIQTAVVGNGQVYIGRPGANVGIGTTSAARRLHVSDAMRLEPRTSAPSSPAEGDMYMDSTTHKLMVYNGTSWQACW